MQRRVRMLRHIRSRRFNTKAPVNSGFHTLVSSLVLACPDFCYPRTLLSASVFFVPVTFPCYMFKKSNAHSLAFCKTLLNNTYFCYHTHVFLSLVSFLAFTSLRETRKVETISVYIYALLCGECSDCDFINQVPTPVVPAAPRKFRSFTCIFFLLSNTVSSPVITFWRWGCGGWTSTHGGLCLHNSTLRCKAMNRSVFSSLSSNENRKVCQW